MNPIQDPKTLAVLARLEALNAKQEARIIRHVLPRWLAQRLRGRTYEVMDADFFRDKLVALDPDKCQLIHLLCRSLGARCVVEVGTSFGVSTIYLAAAVRDHVGADGDGIVIGTEIEPAKVAAARRHVEEAGLTRFVDVREGDVLQTLQQISAPIDFVLLDIWTPLALPALRLLAPHMRKGAIVACDYVVQAKREYADYLAYVRDPTNGFVSATLPYRGGLELSVRTA